MLGTKSVFMVRPAPSSRSTRPKFSVGIFWKKTLTVKLHMRKVGIHNFTVQCSQLQFFEEKAVKEKGTKKSRNPRSLSKFHSCSCLTRKLWRNVGWQKLEFTILPSKAHNCKFLNRKLWKHWNPKSSIQSPKFSLAAVRQGNFERKNWN